MAIRAQEHGNEGYDRENRLVAFTEPERGAVIDDQLKPYQSAGGGDIAPITEPGQRPRLAQRSAVNPSTATTTHAPQWASPRSAHSLPEHTWSSRLLRLAVLACQSRNSVCISGAAWMHTSLARPGPRLVKPCGTSGGPITMSPGPPSMVSSPTCTRTRPSRMTNVSS
jgi:hypothetical protein